MTEATSPTTGRCARCNQTRPVYPPKPAWGRTPSPLCITDWQLYAQARDTGSFVDWHDAFDNASDDQLAEGLHP